MDFKLRWKRKKNDAESFLREALVQNLGAKKIRGFQSFCRRYLRSFFLPPKRERMMQGFVCRGRPRTHTRRGIPNL
jgi:hypothetical protein